MYPVHPETGVKAFDASVLPALKVDSETWPAKVKMTTMMVRNNVSTNAWTAFNSGHYKDRRLLAQIHEALQLWSSDGSDRGCCPRDAVVALISAVADLKRETSGPSAEVDAFEREGLRHFQNAPHELTFQQFLQIMFREWHPEALDA